MSTSTMVDSIQVVTIIATIKQSVETGKNVLIAAITASSIFTRPPPVKPIPPAIR